MRLCSHSHTVHHSRIESRSALVRGAPLVKPQPSSGGKPLRTAHVYYTVHTALCHCPAVYTRTVSLAAPGWEPGDGLRRAPRTSYHPPVAGQRGGGTAPVRRRTPRGPSESSRLCDSGGGAPWYRSLGAALYCVLGPQYTVLRGLVSEAGPFGRSGGRK